MNTEQYEKITQPLKNHPKCITLLKVMNRLLTISGFVMYPCLIIWLFLRSDKRIFSFILIPAVSFLALSVFRQKINSKRPYEVFAIQPIIPKEKKGESFPSRHVFSIFLIASIWFHVFSPIGTVLFLCGILLAVIRVIGGVHFPKDVICGAILGILCGFFTQIISLY